MARQASPARVLLKAFDQASQPIYLVDGNRRLRYANEACCAWLGKKIEELVGLRCDYATPADHDPQAAPNLILGPPIEAFTGAVTSGYVCGGTTTDALQVRSATFQLLQEAADPSERGRSVMVFVAPPGAAGAAEVSSASNASTHAELLRLRAELDATLFQGPLIGTSHALKRLREQVKVAQHAGVRALIVGPAGSGRKQLARAIHYAGDVAGTGPLAAVDCPVMDAELMQLTLTRFLRQREGQSFRRPPGLLLMDVDQLRGDAQQELAGFLLLPGVELQTISTATRSLHKLAARGKFRQDLAFALSTFTLTVPGLARRMEDVPLLAQYFIEQENARSAHAASAKQNIPPQRSGLADDAVELLLLYPWPGNVEELQQVIREACCQEGQQAGSGLIAAADLPDRVRHGRESLIRQQPAEPAIRLADFLAEVEKELLARALKKAGGNKTRAAELLGLQRARLIRRLVQLGLQKPTAADDEPVIFEPIAPDSPS